MSINNNNNDNDNSTIVTNDVSLSMPPPTSRPNRDKRKREILTEDVYTDAIGDIIERRYFPESNFNRSVLKVLEGQRSNDNDNDNNNNVYDSDNLNEFFKKYTSEDNASFEEIHEKDIESFKKRYHWAYPIDEKGMKEGMLMLYNIGDKKLNVNERKEMDRILDGPKSIGDDRQNMPDTWRFRVRNQLNFPPVLLDSEETCRMHDDDDNNKKPFPLLKNGDESSLNKNNNIVNTKLLNQLKASDMIQNNCTRLPNSSLHHFLSPMVSPLEPPHTPSIYTSGSDNGSEFGDVINNKKKYDFVEMTPIYMPPKNYDNENNFSIACESREILARKLDSNFKSKKLSSSSSSVVTGKSSVKMKSVKTKNKTIKMTPAALSLSQRIAAASSSRNKTTYHAFGP
jgi:hypothetical protein